MAHGDVEHFRPKGTYWWLAYCYDNYLYACQICNETYKGDNFPVHGRKLELDPPMPSPFPLDATKAELERIAAMFAPDPLNDGAGYPMAKFIRAVRGEKAGLIDPYMLDPESVFKWDAEPVLKEVSLGPRNGRLTTRRMFRAAEEFYGLNREELRRWRWKTYEIAETLKESLVSESLPSRTQAKVRSQIAEMMASRRQFAGMVR